MKVALVHDWLTGQRGGEQVLRRLAQLFTQAPIYTLVHAPGSVDSLLEARAIHTSWVQRWPGAPKKFRYLLPALGHAMRQFSLAHYDLVLSTSHCVAVAARTHPRQLHVSYVHSPMRYLYDQLPTYLPLGGRRLLTPLARLATWPLRRADRAAAQGPQAIVANSAFVAARIAQVWQRAATVVHPPVDVAYFEQPSGEPQARPSGEPGRQADAPAGRRGFVCANALVPYKRTDAVVRWASEHGQPLTVVGRGPCEAALRRAAGPTVQFAGHLPRKALRALLQRSEALLFAGEEDFGIGPVEALAAGLPVVARAAGGVPESVVRKDGRVMGALFEDITPAGIEDAVTRLRARVRQGSVSSQLCRAQARGFAPQAFDTGLLAVLRAHLPGALHAALPTAVAAGAP